MWNPLVLCAGHHSSVCCYITDGNGGSKRAGPGTSMQQTAGARTPGHKEQGLAGPEGLVARERKRTQREAARRAAERIALEQQQQMLLQQQQQMLLMQQGGAATEGPAQVQPLIPATAAGWTVSAAGVDHPGAAVPMQQQQMLPPVQTPLAGPSLSAAVIAAGSGFTNSLVAADQMDIDALQQHQQQYMDPSTAAGAAGADGMGMPQLLTLTDNQLKQLYQQVSLHTQLLAQLYVLTARDPSPSAQAVASSAGQMLGDIRRLHAAADGSFRGGQIAEMVRQAFFQSSSNDSMDLGGDTGDADADLAAVQGGTGRHSGLRGRSRRSTASRSSLSGAGDAAAVGSRVWRPAIRDMR